MAFVWQELLRLLTIYVHVDLSGGKDQPSGKDCNGLIMHFGPGWALVSDLNHQLSLEQTLGQQIRGKLLYEPTHKERVQAHRVCLDENWLGYKMLSQDCRWTTIESYVEWASG